MRKKTGTAEEERNAGVTAVTFPSPHHDTRRVEKKTRSSFPPLYHGVSNNRKETRAYHTRLLRHPMYIIRRYHTSRIIRATNPSFLSPARRGKDGGLPPRLGAIPSHPIVLDGRSGSHIKTNEATWTHISANTPRRDSFGGFSSTFPVRAETDGDVCSFDSPPSPPASTIPYSIASSIFLIHCCLDI